MTVSAALQYGVLELNQTNITDAEASARYLLAAALSIPVNQLTLHLSDQLPDDQESVYRDYLARRAHHEPVWYIIQTQSFAGLTLTATPAVLIPRPETEQLIELIKTELLEQPAASLIDVGTGSGLIALALAHFFTDSPIAITATDLSTDALAIAQHNATANNLSGRVKFRQANLLHDRSTDQLLSAEIIVANLPYIPSARLAELEPDVKDFEPLLALDGGPDGLGCYRQLFSQIQPLNQPPRVLFLEIDETHGQSLPLLVQSIWPDATVHIIKDLAGLDRFSVVRNLA